MSQIEALLNDTAKIPEALQSILKPMRVTGCQCVVAGRGMSNWLDKIVPTVVRTKTVERKASVPDGLWSKCGACEAVLYQPELERNQSVCPKRSSWPTLPCTLDRFS